MNDLRNDLAKARDEWLQSAEARRALETSILFRPDQQWPYLKNRIESAFVAGWNAREKTLRAARTGCLTYTPVGQGDIDCAVCGESASVHAPRR